MDGNQISDQIVEAINIIAEKKIEAISFDTTIEATIIDDSRASEGIYMVSNGSASFEAVSTETGYKTNDAVLVTIPQGDYSKQKIIAGKQVNKTDNSPIVYQSPFKTILNMTNNLIGDTSKIGEVGMIANHPNEYCWNVNIKNFTDSIAYTQTYEGEDKIIALIWDSEDTLSEGEFNHTQIGIKAQFSTWLEEYGVASGNYGLAAEIFFTHKDDVMSINAGDTNLTQKEIDSHSFSKIIYLDSNSFFGNVYNFESYYTQEKTYDISEYTDFPITRIRLFAYQRNNFKDVNNNKVEYEEEFSSDNSVSNIMPNIFIKDPYICLGAPIEQFTTDSAEIITKEGYSYMQDPPELKIINKDNDTEEVNRKEKYFENEKFSSEQDLSKKYIVGTLFDEKNTFIPLTYILKPFIRLRYNLFYKYLRRVLLKKDDKGYTMKEINDIFNALIAAKNGPNFNPEDDYDWTKNKIIVKENTTKNKIVFISDFLNSLLEKENIALSNEKTLELRWVHKDDITDEVNVISSLPENYKIYWFKYREGETNANDEYPFMNAHWICIKEEENNPKGIDYNGLSIPFSPDVSLSNERIQAVVVKEEDEIKHLIVKSNIIEFTNLTKVDTSGQLLNSVIESLDDLAIRFDDGSNGNYLLYNRAKKLSSNENSIERTLTLVFDENETIVKNKKELTGPCKIVWRIPRLDTMINLIGWPSEAKRKEEEDFYIITYNLLENNSELSNIQITYKIKDVLNHQDNNNTIFVDITKEIGSFEQTYTASATMHFGSSGTSGSDYTIRVNWSNDQRVFDIDEANKEKEYCLSGTVEVLNQDGKNIKLNEDIQYEYSWYKAKCNGIKEKYAIEERKDLLYPINNDAIGRFRIQIGVNNEEPIPKGPEDTEYKIAYCYANELDNGQNGDGSSLFDENNQLKTDIYQYNLEEHDFQKIDFTSKTKDFVINNNNILYATNQLKDRYKITFKAFDKVYPSGKNGIVVFNEENKTVEYYYGKKRKAFIKDNDHFIIDPYDQYYDNLTYYYPVFSEEGKTYNDTTLVVNGEDNTFQIEKNSNDEIVKNLSINDLYILQITLKNFEDYPLIARFPIALKQRHFYQNESERMIIPDVIKGPTEVRYTTSGEIDFDKTSYAIHLQEWEKSLEENNDTQNSDETNGFTQQDSYWANTEKHTKGYWRLINTEEKVLSTPPINYKTFLIENLKDKEEDFQIPENATKEVLRNLIEEKQNQGIITADINILEKDTSVLTPLSVYFEESSFYGVQFVLKENKKEVVLWTQPIYIYQDNYPSTTLNQWSGQEIITDNKTGLITANGFSAGKKEADNTFTGVVIGDWSKSDTDEMITKQTGIYGFNHGAMSYALKDDGTAFFGKDGKGRIYFDGNNARIYSANWIKSSLSGNSNLYKQNQEGMMIDIDNGELLIQKMVTYQETNEVQDSVDVLPQNIYSNGSPSTGTQVVTLNKYKIVATGKELYYNPTVKRFYEYDETTGHYNYIYIGSGIQVEKCSKIVKGDAFLDKRKFFLNNNSFYISRTPFETDKENVEIKLFELTFDNTNIDNFKYALRSYDYVHHTDKNYGSKGNGMEINFKNHVITEYPGFINAGKKINFKLQVGGTMDKNKLDGFLFNLDTSREEILRIGISPQKKGLDDLGNFSVNTSGRVKCKQLDIINGDNQTVIQSIAGVCKILLNSSKYKDLNCGRLETHGQATYRNGNTYSFSCFNNLGKPGNILCGILDCNSIKYNNENTGVNYLYVDNNGNLQCQGSKPEGHSVRVLCVGS